MPVCTSIYLNLAWFSLLCLNLILFTNFKWSPSSLFKTWQNKLPVTKKLKMWEVSYFGNLSNTHLHLTSLDLWTLWTKKTIRDGFCSEGFTHFCFQNILQSLRIYNMTRHYSVANYSWFIPKACWLWTLSLFPIFGIWRSSTLQRSLSSTNQELGVCSKIIWPKRRERTLSLS